MRHERKSNPDSAAGSPRFLLLGGTTHANRGDLGMQAGLAQWLEREFPGSEVRMLASNPAETETALRVKSFPSPDAHLATPWTRETRVSTEQRQDAQRRGMKFAAQVRRHTRFPWWPASAAVKEYSEHLRWADAVFVPGSGSMNSLWWHDWLYPKAFTVLAAKSCGKPVFMTSQGVGPAFSHSVDVEVASQMFNACTLVGVRDGAASAAILREIGVAEEKIGLTGDDALLFQSPDKAMARPEGQTLIGVNLRDSSGYGKSYPKLAVDAFAGALRGILQEIPDARLVFIPISYDAHDDDRKSAQIIAESIGVPDRTQVIEEELDAAQLRSLIAHMDACVGISYHFLMFALNAGAPAIGIYQNPYYQQKVCGLFALHGLEANALDLGASPGEEAQSVLLDSLRNLMSHREELREQLRARQTGIDLDCQDTRQRLLSQLRLLT